MYNCRKHARRVRILPGHAMRHGDHNMKRTAILAVAAIAVQAAFAQNAPQTITLPEFGEIEIVDEVDCTKTDHRFLEQPEGWSQVTNILGRDCRHMPVHLYDCTMFKYRLGEGKGLKANDAYVIVLEYPDDLPRNYILFNRGTDSKRSFCTGLCLGDCWRPKYVYNPPEMLDIPQSQQWEKWTCFTSLQDYTRDYKETCEIVFDAKGFPKRTAKGGVVTKAINIPISEGFDFCVIQYGREHDPVSQGAAVSRILLCHIPDEKAIRQKITFPPDPLPRRHLFWREEMSDGAPIDASFPLCVGWMPWFYHKAGQMHFLGMNTYTKDLLEFGHVQHWAPGVIAPGWAWDGPTRWLWQLIVPMMANQGFTILPYYEWCGNIGWDHGDFRTLGPQRRAKTLNGAEAYTHITWSEKANIDITDPETLKVTKELLDGTILRFTNEVRKSVFVGAFFRTRVAEWPVGFGDDTLDRFVKDELDDEVDSMLNQKIDGEEDEAWRDVVGIAQNSFSRKFISREHLRKNRELYNQYIAWWHKKRANFVAELQKYLEEKGVADAQLILDTNSGEPGPGTTLGGIVTDNPEAVRAVFAKEPFADTNVHCVSVGQIAAVHGYVEERRKPASTWEKYEWQHALPGDDPENYNNLTNCFLAMAVNTVGTVTDPYSFETYSDKDGIQTVIRHYSLNENMLYRYTVEGEKGIVGYGINDMERAGRFCMLNEVLAMTYGDPVNIGYLVGSTFSRGFPGPVREFNANYLALPAIKSEKFKKSCDDKDVTLRMIDCGDKGRFFYIVHKGFLPKKDVAIHFPKGTGTLRAIVSGEEYTPDQQGVVVVDELKPVQLLSLLEVGKE